MMTLDRKEAERLLNECAVNGVLIIPADCYDTISEQAFSGMRELRVVVICGVNVIGHYAFSHCKNLIDVTIEGVTKIENNAFCDCSKLRSISLPDTLETMEESVFEGCSSLESIVIPENVEEIPCRAFKYCTKLERVEIKGKCIEQVKEGAFDHCESLQYFEYAGSINKIAKRAFSNTGEMRMEFKDGLEIIDDEAFSCSLIISSVQIPATTATIGNQAFFGCANLNRVDFLNPDVKFGFEVFKNCLDLKFVYMYSATVMELTRREIALARNSGNYSRLNYPLRFDSFLSAPNVKEIRIIEDKITE